MIKFNCLINCTQDNPAAAKIVSKVASVDTLHCQFLTPDSLLIKGVAANAVFLEILSLLDKFKFRAKVLKRNI